MPVMRSVALMLLSVLPLSACARCGGGPAINLNGAGATFPYPLYSKWVAEYEQPRPARPDQLPVDRLGRRHPPDHRAHRRLRRQRRPDDRRRSSRQAPGKLAAHPDDARRGGRHLQPAAASTGLKLTPEVVAGIFLGEITTWNDPRITATNPGRDAARNSRSPSCTARTAAARPRSSPTTSRR